MAPFDIREALDAASVAACRVLFREYRDEVGAELCFQGFDAEVAALPGEYARPGGRLLLARFGGEPAGCAALRTLGPSQAEVKRLYVRPGLRGAGLGLALVRRVIDEARAMHCRTLKLDTLPAMGAAQRMYEALGFRDTAPYNDNPVAGVRFMALELAP